MLLTQNYIDLMSTDILVESVANDIAKWNRKVAYKALNKQVNFSLSRPEHITLACTADIKRFKKLVACAKTSQEKSAAKAAIQRGLANLDKVEKMRLDKSNIIPGLDKAIKRNAFERYRKICDELLKELNSK